MSYIIRRILPLRHFHSSDMEFELDFDENLMAFDTEQDALDYAEKQYFLDYEVYKQVIKKTKQTKGIVYFQPKNIKPEFCERGFIKDSDKDYIYFLDEPCKILISEVKIIPEENIVYDEKTKISRLINNKK